MATECIRLGCKMNKSVELRISRVIQECAICKHEDVTFANGHGKKYKTDFNTDILVRRELVRNIFYYTDLFSLECLHTSYTTARYVSGNKYKSRYDMLNHVVTEYFLDCTDISNTMDLQFRLSERIFVYKNMLGPGIGYTTHQVGIGSGIPGIYQVPDSVGSIFARSLK